MEVGTIEIGIEDSSLMKGSKEDSLALLPSKALNGIGFLDLIGSK